MGNAMVWGAGGGIGGAMVELLREHGWTIVGTTRRAGARHQALDVQLEADVADAFAVQSAVHEATMACDGPIDLCVYAVGDIVAREAAELDPRDWRRILAANLDGAFHVSHHVLPHLSDEGHLVLLGAVSERLRLPGLSAYAAAKAGLEALGESLRKEQRPRRVTVVRPGAVDTDFWEKVSLKKPASAAAPSKVAQRIWEAYEEGHSGSLDLT